MRSGVQGPEISSFHENFPPLKGLYRQRELKGPGRGARLPDLYEPENDITSDHYDDTPDRFKTLFGTRAITAK